jgi:hypothetical protein
MSLMCSVKVEIILVCVTVQPSTIELTPDFDAAGANRLSTDALLVVKLSRSNRARNLKNGIQAQNMPMATITDPTTPDASLPDRMYLVSRCSQTYLFLRFLARLLVYSITSSSCSSLCFVESACVCQYERRLVVLSSPKVRHVSRVGSFVGSISPACCLHSPIIHLVYKASSFPSGDHKPEL